jgi:nucleoside-diphosphate-sugar epimerase
VSGQQVIYHLAALTGAVDEAEFLAANRDGTRRIIEAAERAGGVERVVLLSSGAAGGPAVPGQPRDTTGEDRPVTMYGRSKLAAEGVIRDAPVPWTILRPPAVYGPRDREGFLPVFRAASRFGIVPVFGDGSQELSLVHAADLAAACTVAVTAASTVREAYYVNHPAVITSAEFADAVGAAVGRRVRTVPLPHWLTRTALTLTGTWAALFRRRTILRADKANEFLQPAWTGDPSRFIAATGWTPRFDHAAGLADTAAWYREQGLL